MGLGDHIMCNAIVRHYAEIYDKVFVFTKPINMTNVLRMYEDNDRIKMIGMEDHEVKNFIKMGPTNNYLMIGHDELFREMRKEISDSVVNRKTFDQIFYEMAKIPISYKWEKFYLRRHLDSEKNAFYNILGLKDDEDFIFIHDSF